MKQPENKYLLIDETVFYEGLELHDSFWQDLQTRCFSVSVQCGSEVAKAPLGEDPAFAARCYQAIRDGGVTPCTLADVVADLRAENEKSKKTLYKP